jgi:hypothetical protein
MGVNCLQIRISGTDTSHAEWSDVIPDGKDVTGENDNSYMSIFGLC